MSDFNPKSTLWPEHEDTFSLKNILIASGIFHLVIALVLGGFYLWEDEPTIIPVPPIMELVSVPPPPKTKPKVVKPKKPIEKPKPQEKPQVEPEVKPEPDPKPKPEPPDEPPKQKTPIEEPVEEPSEEPVEEWDTDFEDKPQEKEVQKVVAPKVDNRLRMFENTVRQNIMKNFSPPKGLGVPYGTEFLIEITCVRQGGKAIGVRVHTSSGSGSLDKYGLRAINLAILPPIPPNYPDDKVKLHVKFVYNE